MAENTSSDETVPEIYKLFNGEELTDFGLSEITNAFSGKLILLLGEPFSGKTTLFASLFDQFQKGPVAEYLFAGSRTQIGFERRCHFARLVSKGTHSNTERTPISDTISYLHLAVRQNKLEMPTEHLFFADISGEQFKLARDIDSEMLSLNILRRADSIFFLVDGENLSSSTKRQTEKSNFKKMLERAIYNNMVSKNKGVYVVITKWDKVVQLNKEENVKSFFETPTLNDFDGYIKGIHRIASRSDSRSIKAGLGLPDFLKTSLVQTPVEKQPFIYLQPSLKRDFQRFKYIQSNGK